MMSASSPQLSRPPPFVIVVTGAQGVGKSTFCKKLHSIFLERHGSASTVLIDGLGDKIRAAGYGVGKAADAQSVAAVFSEHLRRERAIASDIAIVDRCAIDALAYVRALGVNTATEASMYAEVARLMSKAWHMVVNLQLSDTFMNNSAAHEGPALRRQISLAVPAIIEELALTAYNIDAAEPDSADRIFAAVSTALR